MDERLVQFRVGVMVLATVFIAGILVVLFGELPSVALRGRYTIFIHFPEAPGLSIEMPVRKSGVLVGRVADFRLREDGVMVAASIDDGIKLYHNEICRIAASLLGDAELEFVLGDKTRPRTQIKPGETIAGIVVSNPLEVISNLEGGMTDVMTSFARTSSEVGQLARRASDVLANNEEQMIRVVQKAEQTLDSIRTTVDSANQVLSDEETRNRLKQALADLPDMMRETREAIASIKSTVESADRNLTNLEGLTRPLGQRGDELVAKIDRGADKLDQLVDEILTFTRALNNPRGSLGQLLDNPELYQNLSSAVANVEQLTRELRPILRDARVFTDKIARHPEDLGVGGVLKRRTGLK